ncbi:MAG TPA: hypothetical protein VFH54_18015 [Mycobacteriales bacterium]|jgi:class 3 adenylate cyclase|nr:hypothetical protein [Mycobacteriales bacterium]HET7326520.1 hypothetical protein [Nocardioidaceae bacterium]HET7408448.1 hypothetical protein [Mycobacteriales bacterium]
MSRVAAGIPGAVFLIPSATFNYGEWDSDIKRFLVGGPDAAIGQRDLTAVVFTDVVGSTQPVPRVGDAAWRDTLALLDAFVKREGVVL